MALTTPHLRYVRYRHYSRIRHSRKLKAFLAAQATRLDLDPEVVFNVLMKEQGLTAEQIAALPNDAPIPGAPVNTAPPELSDTTPAVGSTIAGTDGTWQGDDIVFSYQWLLDGAPIEGETANELEILPGWVGQEVSFRVTATNSLGSVSATSAAAEILGTAPVNTAVPTITGTPQVGVQLTSTTGTWTGVPTPTYTHQWQRAGVDIPGATAANYTPVPADADQILRVVVTATNSAGSASANSANTAAVTQTPANTAAPVLSGTPTVGQTLTVTNGTWTGTPTPTIERAWLRDDVAIAGQTGTTYVLSEDDVGAEISVRVTGTNSAGSAQATSNAVGPVAAE